MKIKIMSSIVIALFLIVALSLPAAAATLGTSTASVSVNSNISVTITDGGEAGIVFGALNAGTTNNPDTTANSTTSSIRLTVTGTSIVDLQVSGTNFGTGFAVTNAKYSLSYGGAKTAMSTTATMFADEVSTLSPPVDLWFWIDVPSSGVVAGAYNSTFTFEAIED